MMVTSLAAIAGADDTMTKSTVVPQGRTEHFGHAEMVVAAPVAYVRDQATDFVHYKDFSNGRIRTSRLVDKRAGSTDVYLQVPVLHGMVTLWQVLRFTDVKHSADGTDTFTGKLVAGNVRAAELTITIKPSGEGRSVAICDLLLVPEFAAPQSVVDAELREDAASALRAFATRAEQKYVLATPMSRDDSVAIETRDGGT